jgi:hypothetical protein
MTRSRCVGPTDVCRRASAGKRSTRQDIISNVSLDIRPGYIIQRPLPSGAVEELIVDDPHLFRGVSSVGPYYSVTYHRKGVTPRGGSVHFTASGANSRINVQSIDASQNVTISTEHSELFDSLREAIENGVSSERERDTLVHSAEELRQAVEISPLELVADPRVRRFENAAIL